MAKKKNLAKTDIADLNKFEEDKVDAGPKPPVDLSKISIRVKCWTEKQKVLKKTIEGNDIVISQGPAGTGKTYLALVEALHLLKTEMRFKKIVLMKSLTTIKEENLGILPGNIMEKIEPYMASFTGNLEKILGSKVVAMDMISMGLIEILPLAYIRGVTLDDSIIIIDETQNIDMHTFTTIVTRIGENSKMVFLGDIEQIDRACKKDSCLAEIVRIFQRSNVIPVVEFTSEDSVRHPIIPVILNILKENKTSKTA